MKEIIPRSYQQLINLASDYRNFPKPEPEKLLKNSYFQNISMHAHTPLFYVVDYTTSRYLYIDPLSKEVLGYDVNFLTNEGPIFYTSLWHRNDFNIFSREILPQSLLFLRQNLYTNCTDYSFSYNYRIRTKTGELLTMLQRSTYYINSTNGIPMAAVGFAIDITHFKEDSKIIFTIEKIDRNFSTVSKQPLYKAVYFPDSTENVISKRELDVLILIYQGLNSKQIADKLKLSVNTINNHRSNMMQKTNSKSSFELIRYAVKNGLL